MSRRRFVLEALLTAWVASLYVLALPARGEEPLWPSEVEDRLTEVENKVLDVQRKRAVARLNNDNGKLEKLDKEFKELQDERVQLLRNDGQLR